MATAITTTKTTIVSENIINDAPRVFEDFPPGSVSHQGDVILVSVGSLPADSKPRHNRQVADGNTQGSRHILEGGKLFDVPVQQLASLIKYQTGCDVDTQYIGPAFKGGNLTHPEHGNQAFPADEVICVVYQRNLDAEEREARVLD